MTAMTAMTAREIEAYVDAAAAAMALPIAAEFRAGVLFYFALAASLAELVQAVPLGPHDDPAGVFTPVPPDPTVPPGDRP